MKVTDIRRVLVVGAGTSGRQIGLQFARFGYAVTMHDAQPGQLAQCRPRQQELLSVLVDQGRVRAGDVEGILGRIACAADPAEAAADADLLSESVPEDFELKREVFARFDRLCKPAAIFTTNTSYLLPSQLAAATGRPDRFAAYHFHVPVWLAAAVDVMPHRGTSPEVVETLCDLARRIGQVPIRCHRENHGYVFNAMLHPLLVAALDLAARRVADFEDVDRAWMAVTRMPVGPFGMIDTIGLDTVHAILEQWSTRLKGPQVKAAAKLLKERLDRDCRGVKNGRGFYAYPGPAYAQPGFLASEPAPDQSVDAPSSGTARFLPEAVPAPLPARVRNVFQPQGTALLLGEGSVADEIERALGRCGAAVFRTPPTLAPQEAGVWLADAWDRSPMPHLFLVPVTSDGAGPAGDAEFRRSVDLPFFLAQAWFGLVERTGLADRATLVAIVRHGGTFGFGGPAQVQNPLHGGLVGLVKAVSMESMARARPGIRAKVLDLDASSTPRQAAEQAFVELVPAAPSPDSEAADDLAESRRRHANIEVGFAGGVRRLVRYRRVDPAAAPHAGPAGRPSGAWLASGGASGITLEAALAIGRRYGVEMHLLGRTPVPTTDYLRWSAEEIDRFKSEVMRSAFRRKQKPNEAWQPYAKGIELLRALARYCAAGVRAEYHVCDVADQGAVRAVVQGLRDRGTPVTGVLHGAGVETTARLEAKSAESVRATLSPKIQGTCALMRATEDQPLAWFIAFGSLAGRFGGIGQADYCMANEALAKLVAWLRGQRPECRAFTVHWPGWEGAGMAARPASRFMLHEASHVLMPVTEGVRHLVEYIEAGAPWPEIVVVRPEELGADFCVPPSQPGPAWT